MFHKSDPVCTLGLGLDQLVAGIRGIHMTEGSGVGAVTGHSPDSVSYTHLDVYKRQPVPA